jgi:hypothetical protein
MRIHYASTPPVLEATSYPAHLVTLAQINTTLLTLWAWIVAAAQAHDASGSGAAPSASAGCGAAVRHEGDERRGASGTAGAGRWRAVPRRICDPVARGASTSSASTEQRSGNAS